ncbi:MAG: cupin domain-containing protein [Candidatus Acetothermia bacterium]|jgi:quercetin dioxygenase-like cupin family protein|nr:cupin domain-containing protein [Candidatus Acetothermia bacterium]MDH7505149.1 cupin domain-containing protein [Candidatus Acetothermia bacterium]
MIGHFSQVKAEAMEMAGAKGVRVRWLIAEREGAPNFYMRLFEIDPGGHSPRHRHDYEHEIFILEGRGTALDGGEEREIEPGSFLFIPPQEEHQLRNTSKGPLRFLCLIPKH